MTEHHGVSARAVVLVPVKAFGVAKQRLGMRLGGAERAALARRMADVVLDAAAPLPTAVVCDDAEVERWATARGALVVRDPGGGLNPAVQWAVAELHTAGFERVVVAHGDLPHARTLAWVAEFDGVTLVPDRHGDGTNVLGLPSGAGFRFAYGPGSFERHRAEARRLGLPQRVVADVALGLDIDTPDDLAAADGAPPPSSTARPVET